MSKSGEKGGIWEDGGSEIERRRQGGPATCDRGQVRVGTRFALNKYEVSYLPAVRRRAWTCVREHRRSSGRGIGRCSSFAGSKTIPELWNILGPFRYFRHKMFKCTLHLRQTDTNGVVHIRP